MWSVPLPADKPVLDLKPTFEARLRYESRNERDFNDSVEDRRGDLLARLRPGLALKYGKDWSGAIQYQYAHDWISTKARTWTDENSNLSLGYVKFARAGNSFIAGRQKIALDSERLIGPLEWSFVARSFDGLRAQLGAMDLFAFRLGLSLPHLSDVRIMGAGYKSAGGFSSFIYKLNKVGGKGQDVSTLAHHWTGRALGLEVDAEGAVQWGRTAGKDNEAWAIHVAAALPVSVTTRAFVEVNAASGGGDKSTTRTFDNLLPTNHKFYGSMDMQGWRNMNELALGLAHRPDKASEIKISWHGFSLRDERDAWYGAGGRPNRRAGGAFTDPTGKSGRDLGWELDLDYSRSLNAQQTLAAGFGWFAPGRFVRQVGGKQSGQPWLYLSWSYKI